MSYRYPTLGAMKLRRRWGTQLIIQLVAQLVIQLLGHYISQRQAAHLRTASGLMGCPSASLPAN
jgi:hypothetical protein